MLDLSQQWGSSLLRLSTVQAKDQRLQQKLEDQLCVRRDLLTRLFADAVISEMAVTGADPFVHEGTDVTMIFRVKQPEVFRTAAAGWLDEVRKSRPDLTEADVQLPRAQGRRALHGRPHGQLVRRRAQGLRHLLELAPRDPPRDRRGHGRLAGAARRLGLPLRDHDSAARRGANCGYFFVPEAMIRRLVGPAWKISEKRRLQCYNNLVMLNNASLFYRLEYGRSPRSLTDLIEGRFVDPAKIVCPHGGAYSFDAAHDSCTCSLHNRLKYLTPNAELTVLNVSSAEAAEYERYKQRYQAFWQGMFDPIAVRITVDRRVKFETCVLPMANGSLYQQLARHGRQEAEVARHGPDGLLGHRLADDGAGAKGRSPTTCATCPAWPKCCRPIPR